MIYAGNSQALGQADTLVGGSPSAREKRPAGLPNGARLILAPLCGISTAVFRKICFDQGAEMAVTEMICSDAVCRGRRLADRERTWKGRRRAPGGREAGRAG